MEHREEYLTIAEETGINMENERSLHSSIKKWYALPGDRVEARVDNYIIDVVRDGLLIEIQTGNFGAIRTKLGKLLRNHKVKLVYPVSLEKRITHVAASTNEVIKSKKSPKKGKLIHVFNELVRMPGIINDRNLTIEVLLIKEEEIRCSDGKGSWRRKGVSIRDRRLLEVVEAVAFECNEDFLKCLPQGLRSPFSNKALAVLLGCTINEARKTTYCLKKMGAIKEVGKKGNELLFEINT